MRICHLIYDDVGNPWLGGGGAIRAREIYRRLASRHEITIICGRYPGAPADETIDGYRTVRVGSDGGYARSRLGYCRRALRQLTSLKWDVWVHEFSAFAPLWAPRELRARGILFFYHFVGPHALTKHPLVGGVSWAAELLTLRAYRQIVTISPSMQRKVKTKLAGRNVEVECVYGGVEAGHFAGETAESPYILYLGRADVHTKGLDLLVRAFSLVAADFTELRLVIAGRARSSEFDRLKQISKASGVDNRIDLLGTVSEQRKRELLAGCLFFCAPSRYEGWCIAAVEASAAGKAVLGTDIEGLRDAVQQGETGILVSAEDAQLLAEGMQTLLRDEERRRELGRWGRAWAKRFDWERIALDQEAVFERALETSGNREVSRG